MRIDGQKTRQILLAAAQKIEAQKDYLCELDSEVGDGDHGVSMTIGMRAATRNLQELTDPTPTQAFHAVSEAFADEVGASIGPLYEEAFQAASEVVEGKAEITETQAWVAIITEMADAMQRVGKAKPGDKTLVDAWVPAKETMQRSLHEASNLAEALKAASEAAWQGVEVTKDLVPKLGRASRLGERARGFRDAGATSASILIESF